MVAPDLSGLDAQYLDRWPLPGWLLAVSSCLAVGGVQVAEAVKRGAPLGVLGWGAVSLVVVVLLVCRRVRPPGVRVDAEGIWFRRPVLPWRLTRWEQVQGVEVEERRFFASAVRARGGARVLLPGMPPEAAERLAQALRPTGGPAPHGHGQP